MSTTGKVPSPKAPELGAFPLDHFRECSNRIREYFNCLEKGNHLAPRCREEIQNYLACRMEKGLMVDQDIKKFGIPSTEFVETRTAMKSAVDQAKLRGVLEVVQVAKNIGDYHESDGYERKVGDE